MNGFANIVLLMLYCLCCGARFRQEASRTQP